MSNYEEKYTVEKHENEKNKRKKIANSLKASLFCLGFVGLTATIAYKSEIIDDNESIEEAEENRIGDLINGQYVYQKSDIYKMYYIKVKDLNDNYSTHFVKVYDIEANYSYEAKNDKNTTFGQHYIGDDYRLIFGGTEEDFQYSDLDAKIYVDAINDEVVSVEKYNFSFSTLNYESAFRYNEVISEKSLFDCFEYFDINKTEYTTPDLEQMKENIDNIKLKTKTK